MGEVNHPVHLRVPRVLSIAGTDPTGGAGIQADLKSISANHGYGMAVVTCLVAQNTHGVRAIHTPPPEFLYHQLRAVSDDITIDAVKIGMLGNTVTIDIVESWLSHAQPPIIVLDPVMIASSGARLLDHDAVSAVTRLLNRVDLVTPNLAELGALLQEPPATDWAHAVAQANRLSEIHEVIVLVKGGHLHSPQSPDALVDAAGRLTGGLALFESTATRVNTSNTHGTGCSLSAAVATQQAQLGDWTAALTAAKTWLQDSLLHADHLKVGSGNGPIHHFHHLWEAASEGPP
ncbi:bifunctional hydroxymethylpyrimidine kinase/phosphomethylpyrimidine kinase [Cryobacterium sp. PH31-AA6]|uniref:bifunctional hydroxymethylpyrimidine kinase/phosphomethylpyrimidine kinase n=1 Tax=Cryobacterium sp. PH31-AA6 TaxID=3046205 RepID=UPI0024B987C3|nr:bifunctional hydroxymethylpyrimidine kinase/phosphomethylpyrimidine kinase [Cryobacterium sp. PH31-AA6]MDJ0324344.1 bifunctional hydroxymethylpyrimidine kinase/phosphomethylpyrimidine kinase [Cryobacterium sp. PH31-AA6]